MKSLLLVVLGLLLATTVASAELIQDNDLSSPSVRVDLGVCPSPMVTISQSATQPTTLSTTGGVFTCGNTLYSYIIEGYELRRFSLYWDNNITDPFSIHQVEWGVRRYVATDSVAPAGTVILPYNPLDPAMVVDVQLYSINADSILTFANMGAPFASVPYTVPQMVPPALLCNCTQSTVFGDNCVYDPYVDPTIYDLVVAVHNPETYTMINPVRFACAAMGNAETAESYTAWPAGCGGPGIDAEPTTPTQLGSPGASKFALSVCGTLCTPPALTGACCVAATGACTITTMADCLAPGAYLGDNVPCNAQTCIVPVPTEHKSWGQVKSLYR
jgi:hypothetical protein